MAEFMRLLPNMRSHERFHWYWHPHSDLVWMMTWEVATWTDYLNDRRCRDALFQREDAMDKRFGIDGLPLVMRWDNCTDISYIAYTHAGDMRAQPIWNMEYFLPASGEEEVLHEYVAAMRSSNVRPHPDFWVHQRYVSADDSYMNPCHGWGQCSSMEVALVAPSMAAPLPPKALWEEQISVIDAVSRMRRARPHWAKFHTFNYEYLSTTGLPLEEFKAACHEMDPDGLFMNKYLRQLLAPAGISAFQ